MRTLAFLTDTLKLSWLVLDGSRESPKLLGDKLERIKYPADIGAGSGLCSIIQTVGLLIDKETPEQIVVLQPGKSKFNNNSSVRSKVEAALQIAAAQRNIELYLVSSKSIATYQKKLAANGQSLESLLNGGKPFSPVETMDAICAAVLKLPNV